MTCPHTLFFVRHGETNWNREGRYQGQKDIPLNELGRQQARRNGFALKDYFEEHGIHPKGLDFVASPLGRTRETMEIIRQILDLPVADYRTDDRLVEISFGDWEGMTSPEIKAITPKLHKARNQDKWAFIQPNGESYKILTERVTPWVESIGEDTVVVAHGGVNRSLRKLLENIPDDEVPYQPVPQDQFYLWKNGQACWL
ncbi:histidine phosphatase family protein [Coralliovum pocilloporae]|uniref:histidine phosphatase family protein n=1 Tax=Coralliovum pocilloporae TaxID=3066369 RepID=UPI003D9C4C36